VESQQSTTIDALKASTWNEIVEMLRVPSDDDDDNNNNPIGVSARPLMLLVNSNKSASNEGVSLFASDSLLEIDLGEFASFVAVDMNKNSLMISWNKKYVQCADELLLLLLKKANAASMSSGSAVSVDGTDCKNNPGILPLAGQELAIMKLSGKIVFKKFELSDDQQMGLPGVAREVTLMCCRLSK
jgi:hypothetical protein